MFTGDLEDYRDEAIQAARDLDYGEAVILRIQAAKTATEISRIMCKARHATL